jgi:hypothetical protein
MSNGHDDQIPQIDGGHRPAERTDGLTGVAAQIELAIWNRVDGTLTQRFDRERAFVLSIVDRGFRIITVVGLSIALIFSAFGVKTIRDASTAVTRAAEARVEAAISSGDPESPFRKGLDGVLNRAVLDSYALSLARTRATNRFSELTIAQADLTRIFTLINNPDTPFETFQTAIDVLLAAASDRNAETTTLITNRLLDLITSSGGTRWMEGQPIKRAYILRNMDVQTAREAALQILKVGADGLTMHAALQKLQQLGMPRGEEISVVEAVYNSSRDEQIRHSALAFLARHDPDNGVIAVWLGTLPQQQIDAPTAQHAADVALAAWSGYDHLGRGGSREDIAREILLRLVLAGVHFDKGMPPTTWHGGELALTAGGQRFVVSPLLVFGDINYRNTTVASPAISLLKHAAETDQRLFVAAVSALTILRGGGSLYSEVVVSTSGSAGVHLTDGRVLSTNNTSGQIALRGTKFSESGGISVRWFDENGYQHFSTLSHLEGLTHITFGIRVLDTWVGEHRRLMRHEDLYW